MSEFCSGGSIETLLKKFGCFEEKLIKKFILQILKGLCYLHEKNTIHLNLNTNNILIDSNGDIKISDYLEFNIIAKYNTRIIIDILTKNKQLPPYLLAPEVLKNEAKITNTIDVWSLGCVIIKMATNQLPWSSITKEYSEVEKLITTSNVPPKFPSNFSKEGKEFLNYCFKTDPAKRMTTMQLLKHSWLIKNNEDSNNKTNTDFELCPMIAHEGKIIKLNNDKLKKNPYSSLIANEKINILNEEANGEFSVSLSVDESSSEEDEETTKKQRRKDSNEIERENNLINYYEKNYNFKFNNNDSEMKIEENIRRKDKTEIEKTQSKINTVIINKNKLYNKEDEGDEEEEYNDSIKSSYNDLNFLLEQKAKKEKNNQTNNFFVYDATNSVHTFNNEVKNSYNNTVNEKEKEKEKNDNDDCVLEDLEDNDEEKEKREKREIENLIKLEKTLDLRDDVISELKDKSKNNFFSIVDGEKEKYMKILEINK